MKIETYFSAAEVDPAAVSGRTAVVIDVIRATSTMVEALANGAAAIYPTLQTDDAIRLASSLGREDTLLCGERKGLAVEGFEFGNSPREFTREKVEGKRLVMSTTNGTRAFLAASGAERVVAGSFLNLSAVAEAVSDAPAISIICAGKENHFSMDDALCAGHLIRALTALREGVTMGDASRAALTFVEIYRADAEFLASTAAGQALVEIGLEADLPFCAQIDRHALVPEMYERMIRLPQDEDA